VGLRIYKVEFGGAVGEAGLEIATRNLSKVVVTRNTIPKLVCDSASAPCLLMG
jgi:hypothetical protein